MDTEELERRLVNVEVTLGLGRRRGQIAKEKKIPRKQRRLYYIISRIAALTIAYPFIAGLLWLVGSPRPWIHALAPAITIVAYLFVAPIIQRALLRFAPNAKEE